MIPKLWHDTIAAHRREVRDAIIETAATLVAQHGLRAVTMSQIADETGIGRATLYKYFSGVEPILLAWHARHVAQHLARLTELRDAPGEPRARLEAVLHAYAQITFERGRHSPELGALVHQGEQMAEPEQQLLDVVRELLAEAAASGAVRTDVPPGELAAFCLHALGAGGAMTSQAGVRRLVGTVIDALQPTS